MRSVAERVALVEHVQTLWYPTWASAWLKAVPVAPRVQGEPTASPRDVLQAFLDRELYHWLPEDSAYGTFVDCAWRPIGGGAILQIE